MSVGVRENGPAVTVPGGQVHDPATLTWFRRKSMHVDIETDRQTGREKEEGRERRKKPQGKFTVGNLGEGRGQPFVRLVALLSVMMSNY